MKKIITLLLYCLSCLPVLAQSVISGKVLSVTDNSPLEGATVRIKNTDNGTKTLGDGYFTIRGAGRITLQISYTGFVSQEISLTSPPDHELIIRLQTTENQLQEVVVSTGYQELPRERATGSFVQVDRNLLNRSVSPDILSRLSDVVTGLTFNKVGTRAAEQSAISIRGQSTLFARTSPLIVIDNYPYEGDINNVNPNDVESVTVLKDAAAASIWGSRAGNGVIVITTKKGRFNEGTKVSFNSNVTIAAKPNLFYTPVMSTSDFIETERNLFSRGYYNNQENSSSRGALTPVVELLISARDRRISSEEADREINTLQQNDIRRDISRYLYRQAINQQYNLNLSGGSDIQKFYLSGGYDENRAAAVGNGYRRFSLDAQNTYSLLNRRLTIGTGIFTTFSTTPQNALPVTALNYAPGRALYPYARLTDDNGNPAALTHTYRNSLLTTAGSQGLLDWSYVPLNEMRYADQLSHSADYRYNVDVKYQIIPGFHAGILYQYNRTTNSYRNYQSQNTWYTRDQINRLTTINADGSLNRPVPTGGILDLRNSLSNTHNLRVQLGYDRGWGELHQLNVIGGAEVRDIHSTGNSTRYYGYDAEHAASQPVDYLGSYGSYLFPATRSNRIQNNDGFSDLTDRFLSYYTNVGYTYRSRYTLSGSARMDQSNLFGVATNQKGVPLYSAGLSWKLSEEPFYKAAWLPVLKLRVTQGSTGNIDNTLSAYTTALYYTAASSFLGLPYAVIQNPPNPGLRWERINILNFAADFSTANDRLSGTIEYYIKNGSDLIGNAPLAPQTGLTQFRGNTAGIKGRGIDVTLNSRNTTGRFQWSTALLFSWNTEQVSKYDLASSNAARDYLSGVFSVVPAVGKSLYGIYSYPWAGLDPVNGDPQGLLNGAVSKDYASIINSATLDNITYHGSARPTVYGALRNTITYKRFSLSANVSYRFGYYTRRSSVQYANVLSGLGGHSDYGQRWQNPGDELVTQIPSLPASINANRDNFYRFASVLVQKGDNVRLQDINLTYDISPASLKNMPFKGLHLYTYVNNLGILWKAAKNGLDPDAVNNELLPLPRTIAFGLKADF